MKNKVWIAAVAAVIAFSMATLPLTGCDDGSTDNGSDPVAVTLSGLSANGSPTQTTTELTLTFSQVIAGLTAADISLSGVANVVKGILGNSGSTYTLPISGFTAGGTLSVTVAKSGYAIRGSPKTATIYYNDGTPQPVEMVWVPGGSFQMGNPDTPFSIPNSPLLIFFPQSLILTSLFGD